MPTFGISGGRPTPPRQFAPPPVYAPLPSAPSPYQGRAAAPAAPLNPLVGRMTAPPAGAPAGFGAAPAAPVQRTSNSLGVSASAPQQGVQRAAGSGTPQDAAQAQARANAGMKTVGGYNFY